MNINKGKQGEEKEKPRRVSIVIDDNTMINRSSGRNVANRTEKDRHVLLTGTTSDVTPLARPVSTLPR